MVFSTLKLGLLGLAVTEGVRVKMNSTTGWTQGTYTTGYWDCCKPSCSWPGKGHVNHPTLSCDVDGNKLQDANVASVCDGGTASSCADNKPFLINSGLSMGFAAAAVGGVNGLNGDENCGQCYELRFTDEKHDPSGDNWGGSHPDLAGKTMVIQVTNIGYDVTGDHSFDLQIPGAGQGIFDQGCKKQFPGHQSGDFDCDNNYGGCDTKSGCSRLPKALQAGCEWRYDWYRWLAAGGQTNNPYVQFRRVQCPSQLTDISGSVPTDDASYPAINVNDYGPSPSPSPSPTPHTPTPAPAPASCTSQDKDPFKTGSEVKCCDGLQKCLGDWSGNGNWHYNCKKSCGSSLLSHKRTLGKAQQHIQK